jgi:hypothetical protein
MADGTWQPTEAVCHPDPLVEIVRWQICEAELLQAIGRARGIRRAVTVYLMTDVALIVPITETAYFDALMPTRQDVAMARGLLFTSGKEATKAYPDLWETADAFRNEKDRIHRRANPYNISTIGECPPVKLAFQPTGARQKYREIFVRPDLVPGIKPWLEGRLKITVANIRPPQTPETEAITAISHPRT